MKKERTHAMINMPLQTGNIIGVCHERECLTVKILLTAINAKYIHSNLAVYSLKACAKKANDGKISIAEFTINNYIDDILPKLYKEKADILAFSCYIWNISMVEELADLIHKAAPHIEIWLGGPEVSFDAQEVLRRNPSVKLVMCGEGEETFAQLCTAACKSENGYPEKRYSGLDDDILRQVDGIAFRNAAGDIEYTPARLPVDMDCIPFPYKDMEIFKNRIIYYESSRGCPFSCSYCLSSIDRHVRFRSLELVKEELGYFLAHQVPQVKFVDRTFNCRHDRTMEIWHYIKEHDNGITNFHFEITADLLNDEEISFLNTLRPGLVQLEIGVQSTNEQTIREIDRVMDFQQLSRIVGRIRQGHNVHQHLDLIAGLPYENLESFKKSFNDVYMLKPQQLQMGFLKVLKGSKMHRVKDDYGLVYRIKPVYEVISTRWLSFDDILLLKGVEDMVEVYYNSNQFRLSLEYLEHFFESPFQIYLALSRYYERHGLTGQRYSRIDRYNILRNFARNYFVDLQLKNTHFNCDIFDEILLCDLYLRENVKSRPSWAFDTKGYKEAVAAFYSSGPMREKYFKAYDEQSYRQIRHQTHIELFHWNVAQCAISGQEVSMTGDEAAVAGVLFDYSRRDPLTYEAASVILEENFNTGICKDKTEE